MCFTRCLENTSLRGFNHFEGLLVPKPLKPVVLYVGEFQPVQEHEEGEEKGSVLKEDAFIFLSFFFFFDVDRFKSLY